jgi:Na+/glutamate symporter
VGVEASTSDEHGTSSMNLRINTVIALRTSRSSEIFSVFVPAASVSAAPGAKQIYICCQNKDLISFFFVCVFVCVCVFVGACVSSTKKDEEEAGRVNQSEQVSLSLFLSLSLSLLSLSLSLCLCL